MHRKVYVRHMTISMHNILFMQLTCAAQASCFLPKPSSYGIDLAIIPEPIIAASETPKAMKPPLETMFINAGVLKTPTAEAAVNPIDAPKYA